MSSGPRRNYGCRVPRSHELEDALFGFPRKERTRRFPRQAALSDVRYDARGSRMRIRSTVARSAFLLSVVLSLTASARPQLPAKREQPRPADCEISGVVTDAATGRPPARAQVMVFSGVSGAMGGILLAPGVATPCAQCELPGPLRYQTLTDARGRFTIRGMAAGWYRVFSKSGAPWPGRSEVDEDSRSSGPADTGTAGRRRRHSRVRARLHRCQRRRRD